MKIVEKCLTNLIKNEDFQFVVTRISEGLFQLWTSTYLPDFNFFLEDEIGVQNWYIPSEIRV